MWPADHRQPIQHHLQELRNRFLSALAVWIIGGFVGYALRTPIIHILEQPLGSELFYTSPTGSFEFIMRICLLVGFLVATPVLIYQLLRFIEPALPQPLSRSLLLGLISASVLLMVFGVLFGYYVSLPAVLHFFNTVGSTGLHAIITADHYFRFVITYLGIFAAIFQLPLLILFINRITPLGPSQLARWRKFVIVGSFLLPLLTMAPDPLSQVIMALPVIVLYEISIGLLWLVNRARPRRSAPVAPSAPTAPAVIPSAGPSSTRPAAARRAIPPRPSTTRPAMPPLRHPTAATSATRTRTLNLKDLPGPVVKPVKPAHILDLRSSNAQ